MAYVEAGQVDMVVDGGVLKPRVNYYGRAASTKNEEDYFGDFFYTLVSFIQDINFKAHVWEVDRFRRHVKTNEESIYSN